MTALFLNRLFLFGVSLLLLASRAFSVRFATILLDANPHANLPSEMAGLRWEMVLGITMAIATEIFLASLLRIIATAQAGSFFMDANASRLQAMGWALLALQLFDFPAALLTKLYPSLGSAAPGIHFSPGGWIAVLMVFVLSRIFVTISAMQADLEGTV